ncbi:MAG TPA: endopeptidase La [Thermoanaerobaculia bacterium]|nr:endopeptidase La [Thermoanaerobaculia bacterium]
MTEPLSLPVLPLRDAVLFPALPMPIGAGRKGTLLAIERALAGEERRILVLTQRENVDEVTPEGLHTVGTIARIEQVHRTLAGMQLVLQGEQRAISLRLTERDGFLVATALPAVEQLPEDPEEPAFVALVRETRERAQELAKKAGLPEEIAREVLARASEPGRLADLVAAYAELPTPERQELLATLPVEVRLRRVLLAVQRQLAILDAQEDIQSKVREEIGGRQREAFLREQMKAIQSELGEGEDRNDLEELAERLAKLELPEAARKEVDRELGRARRIGREAMEAQVIRTFLETVAELPWSERSAEKLDLAEAERILDEDHYGLGDVKDRVLEFLAVRALRKARGTGGAASASPRAEDEPKPAETEEKGARGPILLFAGPPGVGKTSVAKSIARAMGREYVRISLGGARDEADIRGHRRTYVGAMSGRILAGMKQAGTKNPVFLLDEVDKLGVSFQGDPASALLEVLDPAQNDSFVDHYLGVPFDLSEVLFITTANYLQNIPGPLLDRMEVVEFSGYTEAEKREIARRYLLPRQLEENGLVPADLALADDALAELIAGYTREAGVRQLERELGRLARKAARRIAASDAARVEVDPETVRELLGRPKVHPERAARADQVGVATGMFYTPVGGDILFVEAQAMRGKGELVLTGQLGDVMKESARAAWSYARAHAAQLGIDGDAFEQDLHVHVPAGAIPKDGPSAGVTMATAIVSVLSGRPARHDLAMTGEITLTGRVLPIGGVKEKILGAVRAGITRILLPKQNEADLEDLPADVRARIEVHPVEELAEALALALRGASYRGGRLEFGETAATEAAPPPRELPH